MKIMEDKEKILRWNLQEARKELDKPITDGFLMSAVFGVMKYREDEVKKCEKELNDYLKLNY